MLATGHSTPAEIRLLIEAAKARGVKRIVVTHPIIAPVLMNVEQMKWAAGQGAYLEFVSNAVIGTQTNMTPKEFAAAQRSVGPERAILSSDLGQATNPIHTEGWMGLFRLLEREGISGADIIRMAKTNPAALLGL